MVRPWKHKSGIYYLRRRVPDDLKASLGVAEIRRSLDTRDAAEAKRRSRAGPRRTRRAVG
ncbi:DUF6538 domain-containing protein [Methylobacterium sp. P31]